MKRITLLYPHTHEGVAHASGVSLELPNVWADWLVKHGIAEPTPATATVAVPAPRAAAPAPAAAEPPVLPTSAAP